MSDKTETPPEDPERKRPLPEPPFRKEKGAAPIVMRLINLAILAFLAFVILDYMSDGFRLDPAPPVEEQKKAAAPPHPDDPRIDRLRRQESHNLFSALFPSMRPSVMTETVKPGEGRHAFCGQQVTFRLWDGVRDDSEAGPEQQLTLGQEFGDRIGLAWGIEGMRTGEIREVKIPKEVSTPVMSQESTEGFTTEYVELLATAPELPKAGLLPLKRFIVRGEPGMNLRCGEQAIAHVNLWSGEGKLLFSSQDGLPVYFEIGAGRGIPYGMELAALQMGPGGIYAIVIPPELVPPLHSGMKPAPPPKELAVRSLPQDIVFPENQVVIADMHFLETPPVKAEYQPKELPMPAVEGE